MNMPIMVAPPAAPAPPAAAMPFSRTGMSIALQPLFTQAVMRHVIPPAYNPQIFWTAGMEGGNLSEWFGEDPTGSAVSTAVTAASQSITAHSGSWVMKQSVTGAVGGTRMNAIAINSYSQSGIPFYASWWDYFPNAITFSSADQYMLWQIASYGTAPGAPSPDYAPIWALYLDGANPMRLKLIWSPNDAAPDPGPHATEHGKQTFTSTPTIPLNQWVFIEIYVDPSENFLGALKIWLSGTVLWDLTLIKTRYPGVSTASNQPGWMYQTHTAYGSNLTPTPAFHFVDDVTYSLGRLP